MFLLILSNKRISTANRVQKKKENCFIYIKTRLKKHIFSHNKRRSRFKAFFVFCFFFLLGQRILFSKKEKKTSGYSTKKRDEKAVFYVDIFKLKSFFNNIIRLFFASSINTCFIYTYITYLI